MLPCYIIEEIRKRERERESREELFIEPPELDDPRNRPRERPEENDESDRGVVIIDFTS